MNCLRIDNRRYGPFWLTIICFLTFNTCIIYLLLPYVREFWLIFIIKNLIENGLGSQVIVFRLLYCLFLPRTSKGRLTSLLR